MKLKDESKALVKALNRLYQLMLLYTIQLII